MKVAILGSGPVGQALGFAFADQGNEVMMGSRNPKQEKIVKWIEKTGKNVKAGLFDEAAEFSEIALLCTHWEGTAEIMKLIKPKALSGKIVIDVTNPLDFSKGMPPTLSVFGNDSAGEQVQRWLPNSKVVKCFNIVGNSSMYKPGFTEGDPDMFICGKDDEAKKQVMEIVKSFGWKNVWDLGGIDISRYLESFAMVWIIYSIKNNSWNQAFGLLRK